MIGARAIGGRKVAALALGLGLGAGCMWHVLPPRAPTQTGCAGTGTLQLTDEGTVGGVPAGMRVPLAPRDGGVYRFTDAYSSIAMPVGR